MFNSMYHLTILVRPVYPDTGYYFGYQSTSRSAAQVILPVCPIFFAGAAAMAPLGLPAATSWCGNFEYVCSHKFCPLYNTKTA